MQKPPKEPVFRKKVNHVGRDHCRLTDNSPLYWQRPLTFFCFYGSVFQHTCMSDTGWTEGQRGLISRSFFSWSEAGRPSVIKGGLDHSQHSSADMLYFYNEEHLKVLHHIDASLYRSSIVILTALVHSCNNVPPSFKVIMSKLYIASSVITTNNRLF